MDTSAKYLEMCGRARIFRKTWAPALGDFYYHRVRKQHLVVHKLPHSRTDCTWLPRVDQLFLVAQERYDVRFKPAYTINKFHQYIVGMTPELCGSIEQLMLQFVMYEVYGRRFIGGQWLERPDND